MSIPRESSSHDWPEDGSDRPHGIHATVVVAPIPQGGQIRNNDLGQGHDAAGAGALNGPPDEQRGEVLRETADQRPGKEQEDS